MPTSLADALRAVVKHAVAGCPACRGRIGIVDEDTTILTCPECAHPFASVIRVERVDNWTSTGDGIVTARETAPATQAGPIKPPVPAPQSTATPNACQPPETARQQTHRK